MQVIKSLIALAAGGAIGVGFGMLQQAALRRHERQQQDGRLGSGWAVMPGSMRRTAYLLLALVLVQVVCPMLFTEGTQWWVSGGVVGGYACMLYLELRRRQSRPLN